MDRNKNCTVCNMKLDVFNYLKHSTVCKSCYNWNRRKSNNNILHHNQKSKVLVTITVTIEPQTTNGILEILELLKVRSIRT